MPQSPSRAGVRASRPEDAGVSRRPSAGEGPTGAAAPGPRQQGPDWFWHVVEEGETLSGVAVRHGVTARAIAMTTGFDVASVGCGALGPFFDRVRVPHGRPRAVAKDDPSLQGRNPELNARLARLRDADDARAYAAMTADVRGAAGGGAAFRDVGLAGARASVGLDVIATMATLCLFGLAMGVRVSSDPGIRALCAVLGLAGGMFLEILRLVNQEAGVQHLAAQESNDAAHVREGRWRARGEPKKTR